jgi:hypothetical protein
MSTEPEDDAEVLEAFELSLLNEVRNQFRAAGHWSNTDHPAFCFLAEIRERVPDDQIVTAMRSGELDMDGAFGEDGAVNALLERNNCDTEDISPGSPLESVALCVAIEEEVDAARPPKLTPDLLDGVTDDPQVQAFLRDVMLLRNLADGVGNTDVPLRLYETVNLIDLNIFEGRISADEGADFLQRKLPALTLAAVNAYREAEEELESLDLEINLEVSRWVTCSLLMASHAHSLAVVPGPSISGTSALTCFVPPRLPAPPRSRLRCPKHRSLTTPRACRNGNDSQAPMAPGKERPAISGSYRSVRPCHAT